MPASVVPITGRRQGTYVLLEAVLPERPPHRIGVFLLETETNRGWLRLRSDFDSIASPEDAEVLDALESHIRGRIAESGASAVLAEMEDSLSNVLRVGDRHTVAVDAFTRVLDRLYEEHVAPIPKQRFSTHVPLFTVRAAAGHLGEEMAAEAEDWVRLPEGVRPAPDLFVAHVAGRSMEPRIPDGSLNLFRLNPAGSRQNKILLIQRLGVLDETAQFTVKKYTSRKVYSRGDEWQHERIRLEPLNPEFEAWDVEPQNFAVIAEWLRVIE